MVLWQHEVARFAVGVDAQRDRQVVFAVPLGDVLHGPLDGLVVIVARKQVVQHAGRRGTHEQLRQDVVDAQFQRVVRGTHTQRLA